MPKPLRDWVGQSAVCLVEIADQERQVVFLQGEVCVINGFLAGQGFVIGKMGGNLGSYITGVQRSNLELVNDSNPNMRKKVMDFLERQQEGDWITCTAIQKEIDEKVESVSSALHLLWEKGIVLRQEGCGPRGGYGYAISPSFRSNPQSRYEVLLGDDII